MSSISCSDFLSHIDEWVEGQEIPGARDHSRTCSQCRNAAEDLATIRLAAVTLPETDTDISPRVWLALRTELEREGLIRDAVPANSARPEAGGWSASLFSFIPRPALAGAYVAVLAAAGVVLGGAPAGGPTGEARWLERTRTSSARLSAQLQDAEKDEVASFASLSPAITNDLRKNLSIVDNDIALCEKSVQEEPGNEAARDYLYTAYQQKADLLVLISEHGDNVR